ncbi:MAG: DNA-3-methyladenine glycosylase [Anaerolineales bacterium]|jgi:DNA-3-methyladenine glycosylase
MPTKLTRQAYQRPTLEVARDLLGRRLVRITSDGMRLSGRIIEAEAYIGVEDLACHAKSGRTARNQSMWGPPGHAYVYFTYGMHWMLNIVTEQAGFPAAVLLRGIKPEEGLDRMRQNRGGRSDLPLADGPAKLCQAMEIDGSLDGLDLCAPDSPLFIEATATFQDKAVRVSPRIGLNTVPEPWLSKPWRFFAHST